MPKKLYEERRDIAAFGPKKLYANLGRAAGQDDEVIWNTAD